MPSPRFRYEIFSPKKCNLTGIWLAFSETLREPTEGGAFSMSLLSSRMANGARKLVGYARLWHSIYDLWLEAASSDSQHLVNRNVPMRYFRVEENAP